jgi:hypothetical protein
MFVFCHSPNEVLDETVNSEQGTVTEVQLGFQSRKSRIVARLGRGDGQRLRLVRRGSHDDTEVGSSGHYASERCLPTVQNTSTRIYQADCDSQHKFYVLFAMLKPYRSDGKDHT